MRWMAALALVAAAAPAPEMRYFHFERPIERAVQSAGQTCLVVDPQVFAHAAAQLSDLRVYENTSDTPYVVHADVAEISGDETVALLNLGKSGSQTVFDAEMPQGRYSDLQLKIPGQNFLATVVVTGSQDQTGKRTKLGSYTIFDLTVQRLGRSTVLHMPESDFRFLHFQIAGPIGPRDVTGLTVTRASTSRPKFVTVAETTASAQKNRTTLIQFTVPAHTPVDRVVFQPGAIPANFSRDVTVSVAPVAQAAATAQSASNDQAELPEPVAYPGNILRVHSIEEGRRIDEENLTVNAPQVFFDGPAKWTIAIENHDDAPIEVASVKLEMLERRLCFDAAAGAAYTLYYSDSALAAPQYDYARLFAAAQDPALATLGAEIVNPAYQPRPDERPFTEKHPALLWAALIVVIALLGAVALRSFKATEVHQN
jgi:Protein of unknown function (DUF3999)